MVNPNYKGQASLLLDVLPEVAKEKCFALHGGTAINLFVQDMPRLSVDIDLTYLPIEDRTTTLKNIATSLDKIRTRISGIKPKARIEHKIETGKLLVSDNYFEIKIEVNLVARGAISPIIELPLCNKAQSEFNAFLAMPIVPIAQLYGGKICAALDRQHPRDLFDVSLLLQRTGINEEIMAGFIYSLLASDRPFNEMLAPNRIDQTKAFENQFSGMSDIAFSYNDFEETREKLIQIIKEKLAKKDKEFLISFVNLEPDWSVYDFKDYPSIRWKLQNLQKLQDVNPDKYKSYLVKLSEILS